MKASLLPAATIEAEEARSKNFKRLKLMKSFAKLLFRGLYATLFMLSFTFAAFAQDEEAAEEAGFSISGSVDTYFRTNLNSTNDPENGGTLAPASSFANKPGFSLGMLNLIASYEGAKAGFVGDLVFGPRGADAVFGAPAVGQLPIVNQLYAYWNVTDKVTLTLGNFNTFLGYEVISPTANFNYSTSYMFSYGPFSHTGLKATVDLGGGFSLLGAIMNPTDATDWNPTNNYYGGAQLGYEFANGGAWLNTVFTEGFFQVDLTTGVDVSDKVYVGLNATSASDSFYGVAGYFQVATSDALKLGLRGEYFADQGGVAIDVDESVFNVTASANYKVGNLTIIPEVRLDALSYDGFTYDATAGDTRIGSSLSSFVLAAVFSF